jgi:hypothetical protein
MALRFDEIPSLNAQLEKGIVVAHIDPDWTRRMEPRQILEALRTIS